MRFRPLCELYHSSDVLYVMVRRVVLSMNTKHSQTKLAGKIDKADRKQKAKRKESKKRKGYGRPSARVHPIGELNSQYGAAENELERVGARKWEDRCLGSDEMPDLVRRFRKPHDSKQGVKA